MRAAYDDGILPWEAVEAMLWERFGWTPEQLDKADVGRILRSMNLADSYRLLRAFQDNESLSQSQLDRVGELLQLEMDAGSSS